MNTELSLNEIQKEWHGTLRSYLIGFFTSLALTLISFSLTLTQILPSQLFIYVISLLAIGQAAVQLLFFLHLGQEAKPRWELLIFYFMLLILFIIVLGSLWIMNDLNERMMPGMTKDFVHD